MLLIRKGKHFALALHDALLVSAVQKACTHTLFSQHTLCCVTAACSQWPRLLFFNLPARKHNQVNNAHFLPPSSIIVCAARICVLARTRAQINAVMQPGKQTRSHTVAHIEAIKQASMPKRTNTGPVMRQLFVIESARSGRAGVCSGIGVSALVCECVHVCVLDNIISPVELMDLKCYLYWYFY